MSSSVAYSLLGMVGLLCLLDFTLTVGVVRRLREHTDRLNTLVVQSGESLLPPGSAVPAFSTATTEEELICEGDLSGRTLVGFFSTECAPCREVVPQFLEYARKMTDDRRRVIAVVHGSRSSDMVGALEPAAQLVLGEEATEMTGAFAVSAFPTLYLLDPDRVVLAGGHSMADLNVAPMPVHD